MERLHYSQEEINYDYLTGLPSMTYFFTLAEAGRRKMTAEGEHAVLVFLDFCGMKYFNMKYGFAEGDILIKAFADLLRKHFTAENCSRFGSDHFAFFTKKQRYPAQTLYTFFVHNYRIIFSSAPRPVHRR